MKALLEQLLAQSQEILSILTHEKLALVQKLEQQRQIGLEQLRELFDLKQVQPLRQQLEQLVAYNVEILEFMLLQRNAVQQELQVVANKQRLSSEYES